jgi:hypothetical protein
MPASFARSLALRTSLWRACLALSLAGLVYFLVTDVVVVHDPWRRPTLTGWDIVVGAWRELWGALARAWGDVERALGRIDLTTLRPRQEVWIGAGTSIGLVALLALRHRPTARARRLLLLVCGLTAFVVAISISGFVRFSHHSTPSPAFWVWLASVALVCTGPWLLRRDQFATLAAWERRPSRPVDELPPMAHIPQGFADLVRQARAVRVSLDVLAGLDRDTRQLLWEFCARVDTCGTEEAALLRELGLGSEPLRAVMDGEHAATPVALFEVDAALARFERALLDYRSYAFR